MKEKINVLVPDFNNQLNWSALFSLVLVALTVKVNSRHFKKQLPLQLIK